MSPQNEFVLDGATGLSLGARDNQEDAVLCDVPQGGAAGIVALADGLGGHVSGSVASRIAVTTALGELAGQRDAEGRLGSDIPDLLLNAAQAANHAILAHADNNPDTSGMGATLLLIVVQQGRLFWLSIGDSPLFLVRDGTVHQLNEVHSLAPQFDFLARAGEMDPALAASHPDRSCLTSALGCDPLRRVDCPKQAFELRAEDMLLAASDGILTLSPDEIGKTFAMQSTGPASGFVERLLQRVAAENAEGQDNLSIAVLRPLPSLSRVKVPNRRLRGFFNSLGATQARPLTLPISRCASGRVGRQG